MWAEVAMSPTDIGTWWSASSMLVNHLAQCMNVDKNIQSRAAMDPAGTVSKAGRLSPLWSAASNAQNYTREQSPTPSFHIQDLSAGSSSQLIRNFSSSDLLHPHSFETESAISQNSLGDTSSLDPSDSISAVMDNQQRKLHSCSSAMCYVSAEPSSWNMAKQINFDNWIACITASAGLPLSWVDNAEWLSFVDEFIPAAKSPSRKVLTTWIIPKLASTLRSDTKTMVKENLWLSRLMAGLVKTITTLLPLWSWLMGRCAIIYILLRIFLIQSQLHTVQVHDASNERKTTQNLLCVLKEVFELLQNEWGTIVIAVVTDASGESWKACAEFVKKYLWIIVLDCYAHQVQYIWLCSLYSYLTFLFTRSTSSSVITSSPKVKYWFIQIKQLKLSHGYAAKP